MAEKDMSEKMRVDASVADKIRSRHLEYLRQALASGFINQREYERRMASYDPEESGLEEFAIDREVMEAPATTKFASYADEQNRQRMATGGREALPEGEAAAQFVDKAFFHSDLPERRESRQDLLGGDEAPGARFDLRGKQGDEREFRSIGSATSKELVRIAKLVTDFERDNNDLLSEGWRRDASLVSEVAKIIATSEGLTTELVKTVIRDLEE